MLNLSGNWLLCRVGEAVEIPAQLPGDNCSALLQAGRIPDPYFRMNECGVRDLLMDSEWEYRREFALPAHLEACRSILLNLEMVDTFADITINGHAAGSTENQFRRYRFEVRPLLKSGINEIRIRFRSAKHEAARLAELQPYKLPYMEGHSRLPHINLIRKTQCSGGWDWGIALPTSGIYGDISLLGADDARVEFIHTHQKHTAGHCRVDVVAELSVFHTETLPVTFTFHGESRTVETRLEQGTHRVACSFELDDPQLWFPAGYGAQPLYDLQVATPYGGMTRRIGLRTLETINRRDEIGASLVLRVNGVEVFVKGANWIPADAMPEAQDSARLRNLLESAVAANMNAVRVWGGGQYERDEFYDLCDELGLLVWQDMMFTCALYPADEAFIDNVKAETVYQVKRLRHHAALALWCGNNEVLGIVGWYNDDRQMRDRVLVDYDRLNRELERMIRQHDPERIFWPSSPSGGPGIFNDGWHDDAFGDMHYWEVWHGGNDFSAYYKVKPRFCSEFGFQSFPSQETVESYTLPEDWNVFSPVMDHHQKCPCGNKSIIGMFGNYFRMPEKFSDFLYLSQVQQALAIKTGVEYWRTLRPRCMGTIFWQLNDNWPVASWSSLEYGGRWKQLQYHAKRFYAPVIAVAFRLPGEAVRIQLVSDVVGALRARVLLTIRDFSGAIRRSVEIPAKLADAGSKLLLELPETELPGAPESLFLELETEAIAADGRSFHHRNSFFWAPYKSCELPEAVIHHSVEAADNGVFRIRLHTDAPAFFVWLAMPDDLGVFSDNSLTLLPDRPVELEYRPCHHHTAAEIERNLRLTHLRGTYRIQRD